MPCSRSTRNRSSVTMGLWRMCLHAWGEEKKPYGICRSCVCKSKIKTQVFFFSSAALNLYSLHLSKSTKNVYVFCTREMRNATCSATSDSRVSCSAPPPKWPLSRSTLRSTDDDDDDGSVSRSLATNFKGCQ